MIGAIETEYQGHRFRSRLEARWAVFFDELGIPWKYESQGYETNGARYLPDFYLPLSQTWVEVKGDPEGLLRDVERMCDVLGEDSALPHFPGSAGSKLGRGLLLLGDVPRCTGKTIFHPLLRQGPETGISRCWGSFMPKPVNQQFILAEHDSLLAKLLGLQVDSHLEISRGREWLVETREIETLVGDRMTSGAYAAARQARFEHGERG